MNKAELIRELSCRLEIPKYKCGCYLDSLLDILGEELESGNKLMLQGFGTFTLWQQTARAGRNPRTGKDVPILARNSVKFKPGKFLLQKLNSRALPHK